VIADIMSGGPAGVVDIDMTNDTSEHDVFDDAKNQARGLMAKYERFRATHLAVVAAAEARVAQSRAMLAAIEAEEAARVAQSRAMLAAIEAEEAARIAVSQAALDIAEDEAEQSRLVISHLEPLVFPNGRSDVTCCICLSDVPPSVCVRPCGHQDFCGDCLQRWSQNPAVRKTCPLCRAPVHTIDVL